MTSQYPAQIDDNITLPVLTDNVTLVRASVLNELRTAIISIESALGISPASVYGSVRERLAAIETSLNTVADNAIVLGGDIDGTNTSPIVVGLQGRSISDVEPNSGEVLAYNGSGWVPTPPDVAAGAFQADGDLDGSNISQIVIGIQGIQVDATVPSNNDVLVYNGTSWGPGVINSFTADGDLSGTSSSQTVEKINGAVIPAAGALTTGHIIQVSGINSVSYGYVSNSNIGASAAIAYSKLNLSGSLVNADINTSAAIAVSKLAAGTNGYVISTVSGVPTWVNQLPSRYELSIASGLFSTTFTTFTRVGGRQIDMSVFPTTVGALTRTVTFSADIDMTSGATTVEVQLYDVTHSIAVTGTDLTSSSTTNTRVVSGSLTVGSSAGNIRSDVASQYELQLKLNGGGGSDAVFLTNAKLIISYA